MIEAIRPRTELPTKPLTHNRLLVDAGLQRQRSRHRALAGPPVLILPFSLHLLQATFGMIAFSKRLDALARTATTEAIRLDAQTAPQREIQRQKPEDDKNREALAKDRQVNKSNFRP